MSKYDMTVSCNSKWRHTNFQFNVQDRTKRCLIVICKSYVSDILTASLLSNKTTFTWLTSRIRSVQRLIFLVL